MKKILVLLTLSLILPVSGEQFAAVQEDYVDLINPQGDSKYRLHRGEVVRVKTHKSDYSYYYVAFAKKVFTAPKSSFREVSSIFTEEKRLLNEIEKTDSLLKEQKKQASKLLEENALLNKKISELQIWVEVQRDISFSKSFFIQKTKGSFIQLKNLKDKVKENNSEIKELHKEIKLNEDKHKAFETSFETLQTKLRTLKNERAFYQKNFVEVNVVASFAPVYVNGRIVDYLNSNTKLKVKKDRNHLGWYVFFKNKKAHYISSRDVLVSRS